MLHEVLDLFCLCAVTEQSVTKTTNNQSTQLYLIGTALHVADQSIHNKMYTYLKSTGSASHIVTFQYQYLWHPTLQNKC